MALKELIEQIEKNLSNVHIGDTFASKSHLFKCLGVDSMADKKTVENYVSRYISWKNVNSNGRAIIITDINENPEHIDGRINNGGAHNIKYQDIVAPALLGYKYSDFITYNKIFNDIYGITIYNSSSTDSLALKGYKLTFRNKLRSLTDSALSTLQRDERLTYRGVNVVKDQEKFLLLQYTRFTLNTKLGDLHQNLGIDPCYLEQLTLSLNKKINEVSSQLEGVEPTIKLISSLSEITIKDYITLVQANKRLYKYWLNLWTPNKSATYRITNLIENGIVASVEQVSREILDLKPSDTVWNIDKQKEFFMLTNFIYPLFGFETVYKALEIKTIDNSQFIQTKFNRDELLSALEKYMLDWIAKKDKKAEEHNQPKSRKFGRASIPVHPMELISDDSSVNNFHCKLFGHITEKDYLKNRISEILGY